MAAAFKFLLATLASALIVLGLGWTTSLSTAMYGATLSLVAFATLPLILILSGILLPFLMLTVLMVSILVSAIAACLGVAPIDVPDCNPIEGAFHGAEISHFGWKIMVPYYRWLSKTRHPVVWGSVAGVFLGGVILWGLVTLLVLPGEKRTVEILSQTKDLILQRFDQEQKMPPTKGNLLCRDIGIDQPGPVLDGFNRPLIFEVQETKFRLRSLGFDGKEGRDDFCIAGQGVLKGRLNKAIAFVKGLAPKLDIKFENGKWRAMKVKLQMAPQLINQLRCPEK